MDKLVQVLDGNANEVPESVDDKRVLQAAQALLKIFPEEIWLEILEYIHNPSDLESLSNASLYFRHLLQPQSTLFLFPRVFQVIATNWCCRSDEIRAFTTSSRLACQSWNQAIKKFCESQSAHQKLKNDEKRSAFKNFVTVRFPKHSSPGIEEFVEHFDATHYCDLALCKNPFLGRAVTFNDTLFRPGINANGANYLPRFWNSISTLLMKYGCQIWYCTIHLEDKFPNRQEYYFKLCEWLDLMPQLRSLHIIYYCSNRNKNYSRSELETDIRAYRLPKLKYLEELTTSNLPQPILDELLCRNDNIKQLHVDGKQSMV